MPLPPEDMPDTPRTPPPPKRVTADRVSADQERERRRTQRQVDSSGARNQTGTAGVFQATATVDMGSGDLTFSGEVGCEHDGNTLLPGETGIWLCHVVVVADGEFGALLRGPFGDFGAPGDAAINSTEDGYGSTVAIALISGHEGFTLGVAGTATTATAAFFGLQWKG